MPGSESEYDWYARNPVNPKALRLADMVPGRRVLSFIPAVGNVEDLTIVSEPYYAKWERTGVPPSNDLMVRLAYTDEDFEREYLAREVGLVPHDGHWSRFQFLLDYPDGLELLATGGWTTTQYHSASAGLPPPPYPCIICMQQG